MVTIILHMTVARYVDRPILLPVSIFLSYNQLCSWIINWDLSSCVEKLIRLITKHEISLNYLTNHNMFIYNCEPY